MSDAPAVVEGEVVDDHEGAELVPARQAPGLALAPQVNAGELVARLDMIRDAADKAMREGVDFGNVPGTDKPTLFKPGAEKLGVLFQLDVQLVNDKTFDGDHLTVVSSATVYHAPTGSRLGYGEGVCTTKERKYAYRKQERTCPSCGEAAVIKGKAEYGGGWLCWKKRDGCGAKFPDGDKSIEDQAAGEIDNPDLPDLWNTVVKMAEKRARVDAVLAVTGASALFTQDMEDTATQTSEAQTESRPQAAAQRTPGSGNFASDKQERHFARLLKDAGGSPPTVDAITFYASKALTVQQISDAIDALSGTDPKAAALKLATDANAWREQQTDIPSDG